MSTEYDINYDDKRFKTVESEKSAALNEHSKLYDSMISNSDKYYDKQIEASKQWADTQTKLQNEQTDFAIQKIEQEKELAKKDYTKEQSGAYADWQKQSDQFGVRAEQIADRGMQNTGYSESSQVSMYNTYQNRVMTARESYNRAIQDFNNGITEARLQNNSALAEIRFNALKQQLELSLQGFQSKNQLLLDKANQKLKIEDSYYNRYQDVLNQINTENALAEEIRQFNERLAEDQRQFNANFNRYSRGGGGSSGGSGGSRGSGGTPTASIKKTKTETTPASASIAANRELNLQTKSNQLNAAIAAGASKDKVANAISKGLSNGTLSKSEAASLRKTFTPRGYTY